MRLGGRGAHHTRTRGGEGGARTTGLQGWGERRALQAALAHLLAILVLRHLAAAADLVELQHLEGVGRVVEPLPRGHEERDSAVNRGGGRGA
eukprot:202093-Prymnesium_polylepis.2